MRCKSGDIAITVDLKRSEVTGLICEVLYPAPPNDFILPDGERSICSEQRANGLPCWVVKFAHPVRVRHYTGEVLGYRMSHFCVAPDRNLQPIRGQKAPESIDTKAPELIGA